jgi:hypothetical protein
MKEGQRKIMEKLYRTNPDFKALLLEIHRMENARSRKAIQE